jgi:hypothetical protein
MTDKCKEEFEKAYSTGDALSDSISLAVRDDGEYEQSLARLCFKWFSTGQQAAYNRTPPDHFGDANKMVEPSSDVVEKVAFEKACHAYDKAFDDVAGITYEGLEAGIKAYISALEEAELIEDMHRS